MNTCDSNGCDTDDSTVAFSASSGPDLTIEVISDFICPWCLVADTRLNEAIAQVAPNALIKRRWLPYELNPSMPKEGRDRKQYRSQKFGSWERSLALDEQVKAAGQPDGIAFRHDLMLRTPNTFNAHRLTWLAAATDNATAMAERILKAYFLEGRDVGDIATLAALAGEIGLEEAQVRAFLESPQGTEEVRAMEVQVARRGGQGVPLIVIGNEAISGAQPVRVFAEAIRNALQQSQAA